MGYTDGGRVYLERQENITNRQHNHFAFELQWII